MFDLKKIIVDSREKKPLFSGCLVKGLNVGDYSLEGFEDRIAIERKSLPDLFQSLGKDHDRFRKELERSKSLNFFIILIDGTYDQCFSKSFKGAEFSRLKGDTVCRILSTLQVKYGVNYFFSGGRTYSKIFIKNCFQSFLSCNRI